ncbi:MAG TPA: nitrite/sulfite reductase [Armatimonadota bacterium]|nr:nitrite/sulfite reductase [Armatimonadota bacterium]
MAISPLEDIKARINPYAERDAAFARLARGTVAAITPEDDVVLRWHGLYRHRPAEEGVFMLRIKLPNGEITAAQLGAVAAIARDRGAAYVNLTTRQDLQVYGLALAALPAAFAALDAAGLTSRGACGDAVRNVIGCPAAGLAPGETLDTLPVARALTAAFLGNPAFANLPRKFKIAVSADGCVPARINDVALIVAPDAAGAPGFALFVGGGLSVAPAYAEPLGWVAPEEALAVVTRLVELFHAHGNRENRHQARVKHLLAARGLPWLKAEVEARLGRALPPAPPLPPVAHGDHLGVHPQREAGLSYLGVPVPAGRLHREQLAALAALAPGRLRLTHHQNLLLADVPNACLDAVRAALAALDLPVEADSWSGRLVACPGKAVCMKALVQTKDHAAALLAELADLPAAGISLHISGCPNGCGQHAIADIGLQGTLAEGAERFDLWTGGGDGRAFARRTLARLRPEEVAPAVRALVTRYRAARKRGESFSAFARRVLWQESEKPTFRAMLDALAAHPMYL